MNIGMNGVLVLPYSFLSLLISVFLSFSVFLYNIFHFTQNRGYPYTQRVSSFVFPDTPTLFKEMTAAYEACWREPRSAVFGALLMECGLGAFNL